MASAVAGLFNAIQNPLREQVAYVLNVDDTVDELRRKMTELRSSATDVLREVEVSERDPNQRRTSAVQVWLSAVQALETEVSPLITRDMDDRSQTCFDRCLGNIITNYIISREATKKLEQVNHLYDTRSSFGTCLTAAVAPAPGKEIPGTSNLQGIAMESNLQMVLGYLGSGVKVVGIVGMGGVGKTSLLKEINNRLVRADTDPKAYFDPIIWIVASREATTERLQEDIRKYLQLPCKRNEDVKNVIFDFLSNKRFLLLLDDVWGRLDLAAIGIPHQEGTLVFTTRSDQVCGQMGGQMSGRKQVLKVECLNKEEAWRLFKHNVGDEHLIDSRPEIRKLAEEISEECKGLPLALISIGRAMSGKRSEEGWQDALDSLKNSQPHHVIPNDEESFFPLLKYSYDRLHETTQQCFLFCALFPADDIGLQGYSHAFNDIYKNELVRSYWAHGLIKAEEFPDVDKMYNRLHSIIDDLMSAHLLEPGFTDAFVKMHDVLRDMALWIARDCGQNNTKWIVRSGLWSEEPLRGVINWESAERISLAMNKIETLPDPTRTCENLVTLDLRENHCLKRFPDNYFQHFPMLSYLDLSRTEITQLPEEVATLVELQYLNLSFTDIKILSEKLSALKKLKHLILACCGSLDHIPYGLISNLPTLQEFDIYGSNFMFKIDDVERNINDEVESKRNMTNIEELKILKGRIKDLGLHMVARTLSAIQEFVDHSSIRHLRLFGLQDSKLQQMLRTGKNVEFTDISKYSSFRILSELVLSEFDHLATWKVVMPSRIFPSLVTLIIRNCHSLKNLTWIRHLSCIKYLTIQDCDGLEQIIGDENDGGDSNQSPCNIFPKLTKIRLLDLPELHNMYSQTIDCPSLRIICVDKCPKLKRLPFSFASRIAENKVVHISVGSRAWWEGLEWEDDTIKSYPKVSVDTWDH